MDYIEMNTKNFCAIYFTCAQKRHAEFRKLGEFHEFLSAELYKQEGKRVNILFSNYYLSQVCYDYDDLFEMDDEQLNLKKDVSLNEVESQLGWMNYDLLVSSLKVGKSYFKQSSDNLNLAIQKPIKREFTNERTL